MSLLLIIKYFRKNFYHFPIENFKHENINRKQQFPWLKPRYPRIIKRHNDR